MSVTLQGSLSAGSSPAGSSGTGGASCTTHECSHNRDHERSQHHIEEAIGARPSVDQIGPKLRIGRVGNEVSVVRIEHSTVVVDLILDVRAIKNDRGMRTDSTNFREDVNASGVVTLADKFVVNARLTQSLPGP